MIIARTLRSAPTASEKLLNQGKLLELWLEVGPACHLHCDFCFNANGGRTGPLPVGLMTTEDYCQVLEEFKQVGGRCLGIPGNGEPFHLRNRATTMEIARQAVRLGIRVNIFTSGDLLDEETVDELRSLGVCLSLKWNSFRAEVQDRLVGSPEYARRRGQALGLIYKRGFNHSDAAGVSCLSFVNSIMPGANDREIPRIYRYCREHGIVPDIDTLLPFGRAHEMSPEETVVIDRVANELRQIDAEFGIEWPVDSITSYAGHNCDRCFYHLYIDCFGRVSPCLGANKHEVYLGNARVEHLEDLWCSPLMHNIRARRYTGKCTDCAKFLDGRCNSCLGRFASVIGPHVVETTGCWKFEMAP